MCAQALGHARMGALKHGNKQAQRHPLAQSTSTQAHKQTNIHAGRQASAWALRLPSMQAHKQINTHAGRQASARAWRRPRKQARERCL
eukprot:1816494-Alexandrium_andersonii.AAC.1